MVTFSRSTLPCPVSNRIRRSSASISIERPCSASMSGEATQLSASTVICNRLIIAAFLLMVPGQTSSLQVAKAREGFPGGLAWELVLIGDGTERMGVRISPSSLIGLVALLRSSLTGH